MAENIGVNQRRQLVAKFKFLQNFLHVRRKSVQIRFEIGFQLLLLGAGFQIAQRKRRGVVKRLPGRLAERAVLIDDASGVKLPLHLQRRRFRRLKQRVEAANNGHRQNHVAVFAAHVHVAQHIVGNAPNKVDKRRVKLIIHHDFFNARGANGARDANVKNTLASFAPLAPFALTFLFERLIKNYSFAHPRDRARHRD